MQKESLLSHSIGGNGASAELCLQNNIYYTKLRRVFQNKKQTDAYTRNMRKIKALGMNGLCFLYIFRAFKMIHSALENGPFCSSE